MTFVEYNIINPKDRKLCTHDYETLVQYLVEHHPSGFEIPCDISVNDVKIEVENYDIKLKKDDVIVLLFRPGATIVGAKGGWAILVNVIAAVAASYAIGKIFSPSLPNLQATDSPKNSGQDSSTYSLNSQQNRAQRGGIIPIIYGRVRTFPALITQPYFRYEDNEEYLYQTMCIGQGRFNLHEVMISDTTSDHINKSNFRYEQLTVEDFGSYDGIKNSVDDDKYWEITKLIADIRNLELRGTPHISSFTMRFEDDTITFFPDKTGNKPDLSSLAIDSKITITETLHNDGEYIVDSVLDNVVTIQSHTFVTEPSDTFEHTSYKDDSDGSDEMLFENGNRFYYWIRSAYGVESTRALYRYWHRLAPNNYFFTTGATANPNTIFNIYSQKSSYSYVKPNVPIDGQSQGTTTFHIYAANYNAIFETSYGPYLIKDKQSDKVEFAEVDTSYLGGIYEINDQSDFIDHTVVYDLTLNYKDDINGDDSVVFDISQTGKENNPYYRSDRYEIPSTWYDVYASLKRQTPEPEDTKTMGKISIRSIKLLMSPKDNIDLGDITLLWCKIKASNAISSIGQFRINTWAERTDVQNDVASVIKDIYTNTTYGGRLPLEDLSEFGETTHEINGVIDSKMTLYDAMQMVAKSKRYSLYPVGSKIYLKYDNIKPIRTALFNETNMIKDSLKISYLFEEPTDEDSYKVMYRDYDDFSEQSVIYGDGGLGDGLFPKELELWGCTDKTVAEDMAKYMYKQERSRRKTVQFKTDVQGLIPQFLDRIAIASVLPSWGYASTVVAVNGSHVVINDEIEQTYDKVLFINDDGSVSEILECVVKGKNLTVTNLPAWVHGYNKKDATRLSVGTGQSIVRDYMVTSIKPNGKEVSISATNYDEGIYE